MNASSKVKDLIAARVRAEGPVSFADYMDFALYSDPMGYYRRNVPGPGADYRTSPTLSPTFGRLMARQIEQIWDAMGRPDTFRVSEAGGGTGDLAVSVLESAPPLLAQALRWCFVEPHPWVACLQSETMTKALGESHTAIAGAHPTGTKARTSRNKAQSRAVARYGVPTDECRVGWVGSLKELEPSDGMVLANEVLDNLPFHILEVRDHGVYEIRIGLEDDRLVEVPVELHEDTPLAKLARPASQHLEPGDRFEVRPAAVRWCHLAAGTLKRGALVIVDYGDTEPEIWTDRPAGTVVTYRAGRLGLDPLAEPGECDITAHVDFSAMSRAVIQTGMTPAAPVTQRDWLLSLGLAGIEEELRLRQRLADQDGDHAGALGLLAERSRAGALALRGGLGSLLVLLAVKNMDLPDRSPSHGSRPAP